MINHFSRISILGIFFFIFSNVASAEVIKSFDSDIIVNLKENSAVISESIVYDFEGNSRHGIFRIIPEDFRPKGSFDTNKITFISVADESGNPYIFNDESDFSEAKIRIGDANKLISDVHTYVIKYRVDNIVGFFDNNDEFYWNVTGNKWEVPIESASVNVTFKDIGFNLSEVDHYSYCGAYGESNDCGIYEVSNGGISLKAENWSPTLGYGMTIDLEFPKGYAVKPSLSEFIFNNILKSIIPILLAVWIFRSMRKNWFAYRRFMKKRPLTVEYSPDFSIMKTSFLHDFYFVSRDMSAMIVWFAIHGYIKIHHSEKGIKDIYSFELLVKPYDENSELIKKLTPKERSFLDDLDNLSLSSFKTKVKPYVYVENNLIGNDSRVVKTVFSEFKNLFNETVEDLSKEGFIEKKKYPVISYGQSFISRPLRVFFAGLVPLFFVIGFSIALSALFGIYLAISVVVCYLILLAALIATPYIPPFTENGFEAHRKVKGLYWYIDQAEDDRMNVLNKDVKTPELYEKLLPYAMVFNLEKKWTKTFEDVLVQPNWFESDANFSAFHFINTMDTIGNSSVASGFRSAGGSSGGGGFSGGGGGGGGGGSW